MSAESRPYDYRAQRLCITHPMAIRRSRASWYARQLARRRRLVLADRLRILDGWRGAA